MEAFDLGKHSISPEPFRQALVGLRLLNERSSFPAFILILTINNQLSPFPEQWPGCAAPKRA
jgi:hypothetical protein